MRRLRRRRPCSNARCCQDHRAGAGAGCRRRQLAIDPVDAGGQSGPPRGLVAAWLGLGGDDADLVDDGAVAIGVVGGHRSGGRLGVKDDDVGARHDVTGQRTRWATEGTGNASRSSGNAGTRAIDDVRGSGPRYHGPTSSRFRLCDTPPKANLGVLVTQCPKAVVA